MTTTKQLTGDEKRARVQYEVHLKSFIDDFLREAAGRMTGDYSDLTDEEVAVATAAFNRILADGAKLVSAPDGTVVGILPRGGREWERSHGDRYVVTGIDDLKPLG